MKKFIFICLMIVSQSIFSQVRISWSIPTEREDGTPLKVSEITKYVIKAKCNDRDARYFDVKDANKTMTTLPSSVIGQCVFSINTHDTNGLKSKWSDPVSVLIKLDKPESGGFR